MVHREEHFQTLDCGSGSHCRPFDAGLGPALGSGNALSSCSAQQKRGLKPKILHVRELEECLAKQRVDFPWQRAGWIDDGLHHLPARCVESVQGEQLALAVELWGYWALAHR